MINKVLTYYTNKLENFLSGIFHQPEGIVRIGNINSENQDEIINKLVVSILSLERETTQGIASANIKNTSGGFHVNLPPVHMNLNVVFAAVYDNKRYSESLTVLSSTLLFLQSNPVFTLSGNQRYTIEMVTLSSQELSNIWTYMGGHYYPSVVCKIRKLTFDAGEIRGTSAQAGSQDVGAKRKKDKYDEL